MTQPLKEETVLLHPIAQFSVWFEDARHCPNLQFPEAMCVSTINSEGFPEGRMVLMKDFSERGFTFFTNLESPKGQSLRKTPRAALTFYWDSLFRQVRIEGVTEMVTKSEADEYFRSRPRLSQLGSWASKQSQVLENREILDAQVAKFDEKFSGKEVPSPAHWAGFLVVPIRVEFWQQQPYRLHDRFLFTKNENGIWNRVRLYP